ncbi:RhoGAP domain containing protein [Trichomonas vaginalis G3]|uniref:RhoGAP domain containing protein n=1 Tax=Trichomonas vaginalis (strain ATCC PRA-98 / G3) TaxID=412133 RepID=A2EVS1_TRIV3|nr:GTPase activator, FI04035P family [Trichomonas vaginalis G3]EAY03281.1 RhoGAP domain containing protein [Trichomonas vaginalis G3]KAI5535564.1 GTPase activator, FI04035P family [Trichomonas vaginalis G3]|eukprot:XP_001315504.1 RhoGAP domain containing protein [Trichomonas vaginalis G3]
MRRARPLRFYLYTEKGTDIKYFHCPITNEVVWRPPQDAEIFDPITCKKIYFDVTQITIPEKISKPPVVTDFEFIPSNSANRKSSLPNLIQNFNIDIQKTRKSTLVRLGCPNNPGNASSSSDSLPFYFPSSIKKDLLSIDIRKFATENFNTRFRGGFFSKKEIAPDELLVYDMDTSILPILKATPQLLQNKCVEMFNFIVNYCKQLPKFLPSHFVQQLFSELTLVDETYVYLLKLLRNNPNTDHIPKIWELILVISTFFPPSASIQPVVKHIIAENAMGTKAGINTIAKIAYIRLTARIESQEIFPMQPVHWIDLIPTHVSQDNFIFGAPLLELVFSQRRSSPKCTIPLFMHRYIHEMWKAGIQKMEGVFRFPGNKVQMDLMVEEINTGRDSYKDAEIMDMASVFKRWLAEIPDPIVPMAKYNKLKEAIKNKKIIEFVETLPKVNHDTLGYLTGFLKEFVKFESETKMGILQCGMLFGANVVRCSANDVNELKLCATLGKDFMCELIEKWDTSFIYPLPVEFIT